MKLRFNLCINIHMQRLLSLLAMHVLMCIKLLAFSTFASAAALWATGALGGSTAGAEGTTPAGADGGAMQGGAVDEELAAPEAALAEAVGGPEPLEDDAAPTAAAAWASWPPAPLADTTKTAPLCVAVISSPSKRQPLTAPMYLPINSSTGW